MDVNNNFNSIKKGSSSNLELLDSLTAKIQNLKANLLILTQEDIKNNNNGPRDTTPQTQNSNNSTTTGMIIRNFVVK